MLVREIMTAPAFFVTVDSPVEDALETLAVRGVTAVPVLDADSKLVGIVSEIDLLKGALARDSRANVTPVTDDLDYPEKVGEIMKTDVVTAHEGEDVVDIVDRISTRKIRVLPVVRDERVVGLVTRSDIVRALYRPDDELEGDLLSDLSDEGLTSWHVHVERGAVTLSGPEDENERAAAAALARSTVGVRKVTIA